MEQINNTFFDLPTLLKQSGLDTRRLAETKPNLSVGDYFSMLSEFLSLAPDVSLALDKFENRDGNRDARRHLDKMINLLETMGCEKFVVEFHSILEEYEGKGNWRLAATFARKVRDDFNDFHSQIIRAKKKGEAARVEQQDPEAALSGSSAAADGMLLEEAIRISDDEIKSSDEAIRPFDEETVDSKPLILAVDDSPVILQSVWAILNDEYKVLTLPNPSDIEKVLRKQTPDLFLLDYHMPELSGFELVPIIRSFEKHKNTPIVFLTADGTMDNVTAAHMLGIRDYIVKPFKAEILREKVGKHIAGKSL